MERHGGDPNHIGPDPSPENSITKEAIEELNINGKIKKNLNNPPLKDTVVVPDAGFTVLRFVADNVGYWLFHCHMSWHYDIGMGLIFKVIFCYKFSVEIRIIYKTVFYNQRVDSSAFFQSC